MGLVLASLLDNKKIRFALVGGINTGIDFGVFVALIFFNFKPLLANIISTSLGMICSYFLNRHFTFSATGGSRRVQLVKFLVVTLSGLWIIQSVIIYSFAHSVNAVYGTGLDSTLINSIGKLISISTSLIWNYYWYNGYVFNQDKNN